MNEESIVEQNPIRVHIHKFYTPNNQGEDGTWKNYYTTLLKAKGIENLEADIVSKVVAVQGGQTLGDVLVDVEEELKSAYEKLVKVGLRSSWAFKIIEEATLAATENREPSYIDFPSFQ